MIQVDKMNETGLGGFEANGHLQTQNMGPIFFGDIQENGTPALGEWSITSDMRSITHYLNLRPKSTSSRQPNF